jgi:hypothetical protein
MAGIFFSSRSTAGIRSLDFINEYGILGSNRFSLLIDVPVIIGEQIKPMINS